MRSGAALVWWLCVATALGTAPQLASAEPQPLTLSQMDAVTAAGSIQLPAIDLNVTNQVAVPVSVAVAACGICGGGLSASSVAIGANVNFTGQGGN